ncbi:UvrD-helicase domain-containing protein [Stenotrophomonas maltophilia]|uniref:UvrD-helicase domain-containing protein n=1 Tax=Stenotrophomonas maltophilia TaxID=40324 RepID=UPI000DA3142A|nr:UvrD-helicase domain-containing protein [Stenotrophomonas maltophilia]SQG08658.1 ATP-dependent DNA helicase Rep [Stenotrophomonas maltophilia]
MSLPTISDQDLALLSELMPGLDFTDPERAEVLRVMHSCDVQAAPGSGKTTLLAAKLMLLATKWKHANRGICVISHTNVAAAEISKRLALSAQGASLLGYPHFIGTIHSFINTHLALPLLRSVNCGVDSIDNDIFEKNALYMMRSKGTLKTWAANRPNGEDIVRTLIHVGEDLKLGTEIGSLPSETSKTWKQADEIKTALSNRGIFRHADIFAFASYLLKDNPGVSAAASWRYPLVLIDEMQDTDSDQERLLDSIFSGDVVVQRFGDRNQRILSSGKDEDKLTFPKSGALTVSSTKRFPVEIASIVSSVQDYPASVISDRSGGHPPVVILYDDMTVIDVIRRFGEIAIEMLSEEEIGTLPVKAICSRKSGASNAGIGRHVLDYHPTYSAAALAPMGKESVRSLLADPPGWRLEPTSLAVRTRDVTRALLLCLRAGDSKLVKEIRDASGLLRGLQKQGVDVAMIRILRHQLVVSSGLTEASRWPGTVSRLFSGLQPYLDDQVDESSFAETLQDEGDDSLSAPRSDNSVVVSHKGRSVSINVGTTASVKGETHAATLVLDGMVHHLRKHDLGAAMASIANGVPIPKTPKSIRGAYRGLYVGMSRPTQLLAIATHKSRMSTEHLDALRSKNWVVVQMHS